MLQISADVPHASPNDPAVAAILAFDLDAHSDHDTIAAALAPHVAAAPVLRDWSEDDEWTAAEDAVSAARLFVEGVANPTGDDPWLLNQNQLDRLRRMQKAHRESVVRDRLGEFPGYKIRVYDWWPLGVRVHVWEGDASIDLDPSILDLDTDTTRREIEIAIAAWKAGHQRGSREGAERIQRGIKALLELE